MSATTARAERILNKLQARVGISDCGRDWLTATLDPMHDLKLQHLEGFPDTNLSDSVVQKIPISFNISAPAGTGQNNWQCMVYNNPWIEAMPASMALDNAGQLINASQNPLAGTLGGITVLTALDSDSGTPFSLHNFITANVGAGYTMTSHSIPAGYLVGKGRVVSSGVEVHNTTATNFRQGTATVFRQPVPDYEVNSVRTFFDNANSGFESFTTSSCVEVPAPPTNIANAMLLPGSRQWEALEGSYQAHVLHSSNIPTEDRDFIQPIYYDGSSPPLLTYLTSTPSVHIGIGGLAPILGAQPSVTWTKFDMSGTIFSGLGPTTTLTVTWNVYIERFPDNTLTDLVVLATPSPAYDPRAIEIYNHAVLEMPVGVMAKENGLGDWFSGAISKVADFVAPAASFVGGLVGNIPHPYAQAASMGLKTVGGIAEAIRKKRR